MVCYFCQLPRRAARDRKMRKRFLNQATASLLQAIFAYSVGSASGADRKVKYSCGNFPSCSQPLLFCFY
jgi:hypothetical protein